MANVIINGSTLPIPDVGTSSPGPGYAVEINAILNALNGNVGRDQLKVIYVNKNGNDSYDGLTPAKAKLTITAANTAAASSYKAIWVTDSAVYSESVTLADKVDLFAPTSEMIGTLTATSFNVVKLYWLNGDLVHVGQEGYFDIDKISGAASNQAGATTYLRAGSISGAQTWVSAIYKNVLTEGATSMPASAVTVNAAGFSGVLNTGDTDVQTALTTIDAYTPPAPIAADVVVNSAVFSKNLSITDADVQTALETIDQFTLGGGGGSGDWEIQIKAGDFFYPTSNPAPLDTFAGGLIKRHLFDDTTQEFIFSQFSLPEDISAFTKIYLTVHGSSVSAATGKNVKMILELDPVSNNGNETMGTKSQSYTAGDQGVNGSNNHNVHTSNYSLPSGPYAWAGNDFIKLAFSRVPATSNNLTGDYGVELVKIRLSAT